jgi:hypothetical protein
MQDNDLSAKFEQISNRAKAATDELKAAGDTTKPSPQRRLPYTHEPTPSRSELDRLRPTIPGN